jgi:NitT/TauT family transport system ATP-binding protein
MATPEALLELVGLREFADALPSTLSGGMQQRVSLARTLAVGAPVWLMDEPFAALDELTRDALADEVTALWALGRPTVIWVTHHIGEAVKLADEIVVLTPSPGRVGARFPVDLEHPRDETSPAFQMVVRRARAFLRDVPGTPRIEAAG